MTFTDCDEKDLARQGGGSETFKFWQKKKDLGNHFRLTFLASKVNRMEVVPAGT